MIVQCQACQTRFRLADEKVKPGGTKVRCSKCKEIFTVTPPEPEPVEESVDFGSFNMEAVADETQEEPAAQPTDSSTEPTDQSEETSSEPEAASDAGSDDIDFSGLEDEMGSDAGSGEELADDFSFAETDQPAEDSSAEEDTFTAADMESTEVDAAEEESADFSAAFEETDDPAVMEFDFEESPEAGTESSQEPDASEESSDESAEFSFDENEASTAESGEPSFDESEEGSTETGDFSFDEESEETKEEESGEFSFGDDDDDNAFSFDDQGEDESESSDGGDFSFDEETPFGDSDASEWGDDSSKEGDSFDFEEPQFDAESDSAAEPAEKAGGEEGGLQFGEIDFASEGGESDSPGGAIEDDFASATMQTQPEEESFVQQEQAPPPSRDYDDEEPLPAPPKPKKSSLSRILLLLVLLLVALGGAAAYMFTQGGTANLNMVTEYLPFLKDYIGDPQEASPADSIDINISGSSYVNNGEVGQMLVIQGSAVNKHPASRSSITIKGVLLDSQGKTLLQQTVFCGNKITDKNLASLPFKDIEEAMNNEFGDGLSNMNIASGAAIPFTIVFRNLPSGIANINVEVVDSKPGAS